MLTTSYWPATEESHLLDSNCGDVLREQAHANPNRIALKSADPEPARRRIWTYRELLEEAESYARFFVESFPPGTRIAVMGGNQPEWVLLQFALSLSRMVLVTVNPAYRPSELAYVLTHSGARAIFFQRKYRGVELFEVISEAADIEQNHTDLKVCFDELARIKTESLEVSLPTLNTHDPVMIQYTSGTTGRPKGVVLTNHGVTNCSRFMAEIKQLGEDTINLGSPPLYHTGGCVGGVLSSVQAGGTFLLPESFDADWVLDLVEQERVTYAFAVPTMLVAMLESQRQHPRNLGSLKTIFTGGTIVPVEIVRRVEAEFQVSLIIGYGMTETSPAITHTRLTDTAEQKSQTVGYALPHVEVQVVNPCSGEVVAIGEEGEICTRGFLVMQGYHQNPEATAETIDANGWLHTGDLGSMDGEGYCTISGRLKDMIIRGGENIYPREIEDILYCHPSVLETAVVGVSDDYWGEQVACVIVPTQGASLDLEELKSFCHERLARHKVPKFWYSVDALPMTVSGKVQKFVLKNQIEADELICLTP